MYNHHKRILPTNKRDEQFRTEFPANYYNTSSSLYSYSPTSTSDCPEHGRSRRRTTLILVTSVVLATLGVLSIAGIAAYLGIISKSISNNASQYEESYLQSNTSNSVSSSEEESLTYGHGRSSHDSGGFIDLTNSLSDTKTGIESKEDDDLSSSQKVDLPVDVDRHKNSKTKAPEIITGTKMNLTLNSNPIEIAPRPVTVVVTSSSASTSSSSSSQDQYDNYNNKNTYNPVEIIPPPTTKGIENSVSYFTEESTSVKSYTKPPTRNNKNRHRYPLTNSHSLIPSTTTQVSRGNSKEEDQLSKDKNSDEKDRDIIDGDSKNNKSFISSNSNRGNSNINKSQGIIHVGPSDAKSKKNQLGQKDNDDESAGSLYLEEVTEKYFNNQMNQNAFEKRHGLADRPDLHHSNNEDENEDDPQKATHPLHHSNNNHYNHQSNFDSATNKDEATQHKRPTTTEDHLYKDGSQHHQQQSTPDYFVPITPIVSSEREDDGDDTPLLNNHKMHLTFDRISPDFYDKNPWTPLLTRPNLDKRPRVDINNHQAVTTPEPIIIWNTEYAHNNDDTNPSPQPPASPQNYYGYGHSAPSDSNIGGSNQKEIPNLAMDDNRSISHGLSTNSSTLGSNHEQTSMFTNTTMQSSPSDSTSSESGEETAGGFRPVLIPSYTVIIPHIPNPKNSSTLHFDNESAKANEAIKLEDVVVDEDSLLGGLAQDDRNLHNSYKMDRMGELDDDAAVSQEKLSKYNVNESNKQKNDNEQVKGGTKNKAEEIKDEDYGEQDDINVGDNPSPTKIYRLDPDNVDVVPDTLGSVSPTVSSPKQSENNQNLVKLFPAPETINSSSTSQEEKVPDEPDPIMKTTTDLIMSTLGSLNLIKSTSNRPQYIDIESKLRASDIPSEALESEEEGTESPLFPPVRSYVGVNLPLRPKPSASSEEVSGSGGPSKQLRMTNDEEGGFPVLRPDLTTASSLQKVLSMMMKFEGGDESSRQMHVPTVNITRNNVNLVLAASSNGSLHLTTDDNVTQSPKPTTSSLTSSTTTHREQKSYSNRDSKIDEQFVPLTNVEHVPVPLIVTESPETSENLSKLKLSSVRVNDKNSPVYKFVLRKGQSVEDLLKEIFQNYTDVEQVNGGGGGDASKSPQSSSIPSSIMQIHNNESRSYHHHSSMGSPAMKSLDDSTEDEQTTTTVTVGMSSTTVKINHNFEMMPHRELLPLHLSTSDPPILQTATSIVINDEDGQIVEECPANSSFRCVSTGKCIPSYLRCNFIKECPDNSDEANCSCADFLKANGNGRKLCDGVVDCADASDEYTYCEYCQPGQYICAGSRTCINRTQICDSKRDCQNGDDENECVKIGRNSEGTDVQELSSTYHKNGQLMVRKKGVWGKLCVETFSSVVSHWEVKDLARAVCKALTFSDFESVERVEDKSSNDTKPYYELFYGVSNNETEESGESSSSESTPRVGLGFKKTECKSKLVVNVTCQDLQCGVAPRSFTQTARIVGGANSMPGKWPWQAALYKNGEYQCGATLISSRWLLSAGHCFYNAQDDYWVARLGTLRRGATVLSPYEQVVRITHIFLHPQYQNVGFVNDVSLLRLETEVNFTDYVRPVCLPSRDTKIRDGRMCSVVGWGQLFEVGRVFPDTLQEVQLPLISTTECRKRTLFLPLYKLTDQMFCAGFDRGGRDACLGDSGGPLMCPETDGRWSLYGVTSNGYGCARANRPGVYTRVSSYLDWIYEKMNLDSSFVYRDKSKPCPGHRCLLGECLEKRQICNGIRDCIEDNGSDEMGPNCTFSGLKS